MFQLNIFLPCVKPEPLKTVCIGLIVIAVKISDAAHRMCLLHLQFAIGMQILYLYSSLLKLKHAGSKVHLNLHPFALLGKIKAQCWVYQYCRV